MNRRLEMKRDLRALAAAGLLLLALVAADAAFAQKVGGVLKISHFDSPASMSILEESTAAALRPMMGVFNNLVMYKQDVPQASLRSIVPEVATNGDFEVTFRLKRPQPALLAMLASGWSPVYPCHVSTRDMRQRPIGTGPFKFVEFKPNEVIRVTRNPDYWKEGRPYLDGIEWTIIKDVGTRVLAFIAGKSDLFSPYGVTIPLLKDIKSQAPDAICEVTATNVNRTLIINRTKPPFDNPDLRRATSLTLDRKAFIDIITEGQGDIGGTMLPAPEGVWSMPPEMLKSLP